MRLGFYLACGTLWSSALAAGPPDIPRYVTAIHCDPQHAELIDWVSLKNLVVAADKT